MPNSPIWSQNVQRPSRRRAKTTAPADYDTTRNFYESDSTFDDTESYLHTYLRRHGSDRQFSQD